ncbi:hypothetical protein BTVI_64550 [Pitangus sulphuratus]|nr:hypothetical protein BTVI_64550 [Pitangus sulphuratus]
MIRELESQGVISKIHSPFNNPIWPVRKSDGEWRLTVDYRGLNEVTVPDMFELQYELESKTAALEKSEAPEYLQYIDDIIIWGDTAEEVFEKGEKIIQILLGASFAIKKKGCLKEGLTPWEAYTGTRFWQGPADPWREEPTLEQVSWSATTAFEKFKFPLDARDTLLFVVCLQICIIMVYLICEARTKISQEGVQKPTPGVDNFEWHGLWEDMGKFLENFSAPMTWKFTLEQLQDPIKVMRSVRERCFSRSMQLVVACRARTAAYQKLLSMVQHLQEESKGNKIPDTTATQGVAKPEGQPQPIEVTPVQKRKYKTKSVCLVDDDGETRPSQTVDPEPEIITESLSFDTLHNLWKDIA